MPNNFERMIELVTSAFDMRNDPDQISVTPAERAKLEALHPATLSELANDDGPIVWILLVPTTQALMHRFIAGAISEKQLLEQTHPGDALDTIYLCSASVLPEFQHKGLAKKVALDAIHRIQAHHPVNALFYWPFSEGGKATALSLARTLGLPLFEKPADH